MICLLKARHLILRKIHIKFNKTESQAAAKIYIFFQRMILDERGHTKLYHVITFRVWALQLIVNIL